MTEIHNISDLIEVLDQEQEKRGIVWFRGHREATWALAPSVSRGYTEADERDLTNRFRSRCGSRYADRIAYRDGAKWLGLMQHYGLPTRLLDWTRSPLVASYFALERYIYDPDAEGADGCIWLLDPHLLNLKQFRTSVTPQIDAKLCENFVWPAFAEPTPDYVREPRYFDNAIAVMASEYDARMFVQQGCYTIHSRRASLTDFDKNEIWLRKLTIPARSVRKFARQIRLCGFRRGDIFPDLQNLSEEIKLNKVLDQSQFGQTL